MAGLAADGETMPADLRRECDYEELVISAHLSLLLGCECHAIAAPILLPRMPRGSEYRSLLIRRSAPKWLWVQRDHTR